MNISDVKVLIVDDHSLTRNLVKAILIHYGFSCLTAEGGRSALRKLSLGGERIDLVICDWNMPDLQGIDVLKTIRAGDHKPDIPFLFLTAESSSERVRKAIEAGVDDYIIKPFNAAILGDKLKKILARTHPEALRTIQG
jgi:two-component system chemotaxis response regulator CheY